ncbi:MAG: hypothetical protein EPN93_03895 [Spirochaetes bacterium]|nr:MAG: hypothetical protein EPN93_03895 [Spirochaetota bacterium]
MKSGIPYHFWPGVVLIVGMECCILVQANAFTTWATPVLWTGLILVFDAVLVRTGRASLIRTGAIVPLAVISVVSWWVFEWFNIFLSNWHYLNLTPNLGVRYFGYVWSFATIVPGVLLAYGMLSHMMKPLRGRPLRLGKRTLAVSFILGLIFLAVPIVPFSMYYAGRAADESLFIFLKWATGTHLSEYTAAFVWIGFFLLIEPLNYSMGNPSLAGAMTRGNYRPAAALSLAGLLCGYLWEFWNYWAHTKWFYTVPILGDVKLFEMPVLGYLGFVAFAWELYALTALVYPRAIYIVEGRGE